MKNFNVEYLEEAVEFIRSVDEKAAKKLLFNISKAQLINDASIFKKLKNSDIWEFRAEYNSIEYRLFAFWDKNRKAFVVCTHGIIKKSQKTPVKEIEKAEKIRKDYLGL